MFADGLNGVLRGIVTSTGPYEKAKYLIAYASRTFLELGEEPNAAQVKDWKLATMRNAIGLGWLGADGKNRGVKAKTPRKPEDAPMTDDKLAAEQVTVYNWLWKIAMSEQASTAANALMAHQSKRWD